jgi:DNA-binding MarR family transcriptional regulator
MEDEANIRRQNDLIISLLGRLAYTNDRLKGLVQKGGKKPQEMLSVYNLCDGGTAISEIAKKANVSQPSVTDAVNRWEGIGIIFKRVDGQKVLPRRLFIIE